jgi:hypothetical protein
MTSTVKRLRTSEVIELIRSEKVVTFKNYISEHSLRNSTIEFLFEHGSDDMIEVYVNTVYPWEKEFTTYQTTVMRLANRQTLATYYMYADILPEGEIELIKRNDINPFAYYLANKELSMEAFIYLINEGEEDMIECYINNNSIVGKKLDYFLNHAKINDIAWYYTICTCNEREVLVDKLEHLRGTSRFNQICAACPDINLWVD